MKRKLVKKSELERLSVMETRYKKYVRAMGYISEEQLDFWVSALDKSEHYLDERDWSDCPNCDGSGTFFRLAKTQSNGGYGKCNQCNYPFLQTTSGVDPLKDSQFVDSKGDVIDRPMGRTVKEFKYNPLDRTLVNDAKL